MTELYLEAIRDRLREASGGPWELVTSSTLYMNGKQGFHIRAEGQPEDRIILTCFPADAEFIAHAREDIEKLLNRVEELEEELDEAEDELRILRPIVAGDFG